MKICEMLAIAREVVMRDKPMDVLMGFVKGDFAESIVRNVFKASGYNAYVYGEWKAVSTHGVVKTDIGIGRTDHPDIRISKKGANLHFLEVKFRAYGFVRRKLHEQLIAQTAYWSRIHPVSVVLVNCWWKPYFNVVDLASVRFNPDGIKYDISVPLAEKWELDSAVYARAEKLIESCQNWGNDKSSS